MSEPANRKKKWKESLVLVLLLLILGIGGFFGISRWERTPHVYSYGDGMRMKQENVVQAKNNEESEKKDDQEKQTETEETPSPEPEQTPMDSDDGEELPDSTPKQEENPDNRRQDPTATSDVEGEGDASNEDGEQAQEGSNGGDENNGDGGANPVIGSEDGQEGDESGGEKPNAGATPKVSSTPEPTPTKSPVPESTEETDKAVALQCSWPDKDNIKYGETIPRDTIVVKAEYASGKVTTLSAGDYMITGLKNDSLGEHTMTVIYQGIYYQMDYTVHNFFKSISYSWPTKDRCYYDEYVETEIVVYTHMADGSIEEVYEGFTVSGIDNKNTSGEQTFTISYGGFSVTGTCRFYDLEYIEVVKYYDGDTLVDEVTTTEINEDHESEIVRKKTGETQVYNGVEYALDDVKLTVDGVSKSLPYAIKERDLKVKIEKTYRK